MTHPFSPLVADLMQASLTQTHAVTNSVIDNLTERAELAEATLAAIRTAVLDLVGGDFMPTPAAIERALYPRQAVINSHRPGTANPSRPWPMAHATDIEIVGPVLTEDPGPEVTTASDRDGDTWTRTNVGWQFGLCVHGTGLSWAELNDSYGPISTGDAS